MEKIKYDSVLVIDDHNMIINGINLLIGNLFKHFYIANDGAEGRSKALVYAPQLIIVDYGLPDMQGDTLIKELKYKVPNAKILVYTFTLDASVILKLFKLGIDGYVLKSENDIEFLHAIDKILHGKEYFCKVAKSHIVNRYAIEDEENYKRVIIGDLSFSPKEIALIKLLCKQLSTKEIVDVLGLTLRTVEQYRSNLLHKLNAKNLGGVIRFALQHGIVNIENL